MTDDQLLELLMLDRTIRESGDIEYRLDGKLHRTPGATIIKADGSERWYQHGEFNRDDGPAVTYASGSESWCQHGELLDTRAWIAHNTHVAVNDYCAYQELQMKIQTTKMFRTIVRGVVPSAVLERKSYTNKTRAPEERMVRFPTVLLTLDAGASFARDINKALVAVMFPAVAWASKEGETVYLCGYAMSNGFNVGNSSDDR